MRVAQVTNLALQSEPFFRTWRYGAGFAVRHYLPDYLSLCGATFPTRSLVHALILPTSHKDLKRFFLTIRHCQVEVNIKNRLPHNDSLFTTACLSKIRQSYLEKPATSSFLYGGL